MDDQPKRKPGRPPLPPGEGKDRLVKARVTANLAEKYFRIGGSEWLRRAIERAKEPT